MDIHTRKEWWEDDEDEISTLCLILEAVKKDIEERQRKRGRFLTRHVYAPHKSALCRILETGDDRAYQLPMTMTTATTT